MNKSRFKPFSTAEGRVLFCGLALLTAYLIFLAVAYFISPAGSQVLIGMTATSILFGRTAGMSFGFALDYGLAAVIAVNLIVEILLVLIIYPLFVFSWRKLLVFEVLVKFMLRVEAAADRHQEKLRRYGVPSLFLFVFLPFWLTGPLVGAVIGFFLGLRPWVNMAVVLSATTLACIAWGVFLRALHEWASGFNPFAPVIILFAFVVFAVLGYLWQSRRHRHE